MSPPSGPLFLASCFLFPLAVSWLLTAFLIRRAPRLGLVDYPAARKVHSKPTPKGGGLAIFAALVLTVCLLPLVYPPSPKTYLPWVLGLIIVLLGLVDDLRPLPWQLRLGVQTVVAAVGVVYLVPPTGAATRVAAVLWVVGLINAFNMLDNMDALSGGVALVAASVLAAAAWLKQAGSEASPEALPFVMLAGAILGFLWFNRPPARIFMGDAGSTFLGFFLGLGGLQVGLEDGERPWAWMLLPCVFAVPCYDLLTVVSIRLSQGRSPFHADKQHLSHRLVALGLSRPAAVAAIHLLALAGGAGGLVVYAVTAPVGMAPVAVGLAATWAAVAVVELRTFWK
jgi:UDP-GlcNAc:undecaprenyl-phosphate/decaprenyl-phosphate GlcNAc-1-phosphate transferase